MMTMNATRYTREGDHDVNPVYDEGERAEDMRPWVRWQKPQIMPWPTLERCAKHPTCEDAFRQGPLFLGDGQWGYVATCRECLTLLQIGQEGIATSVLYTAATEVLEEGQG